MLYKETYHAHAATMRSEQLPEFKHYPVGTVVKRVELRASGTCEFDGEPMQFQELRVYVVVPE